MTAKYNPNISRNWRIRFLTRFDLFGITFNSKGVFLYPLFRIYRDFRIWFCGYKLQTPILKIQNPKSSKQKRTSWNFTMVLGRLLDKLSHVSSTFTTITVTVSVVRDLPLDLGMGVVRLKTWFFFWLPKFCQYFFGIVKRMQNFFLITTLSQIFFQTFTYCFEVVSSWRKLHFSRIMFNAQWWNIWRTFCYQVSQTPLVGRSVELGIFSKSSFLAACG